MPLPNIFSPEVATQVTNRINALSPSTTPKWGKMSVDQMLAHCNVTYEMVYDNNHPKPNAFVKFMLKAFVKKSVVNETPYKHNGQTAPAFVIKGNKDFEAEKQRLINFVSKTQEMGEASFDNKESHSFGNLSKAEWNNLFYKHLDHHLGQFGV